MFTRYCKKFKHLNTKVFHFVEVLKSPEVWKLLKYTTTKVSKLKERDRKRVREKERERGGRKERERDRIFKKIALSLH